MKKSILFFAALAALFSCSKENPVDNYNPADDTYSVTLTASAPGADTKTTLVDGEGTKFVHWSKGDAIKVLFFPHVVYNAEQKGPCGIFNSSFTGEVSQKAYFCTDTWSWENVDMSIAQNESMFKDGIAVYPHTVKAESNKIYGKNAGSVKSEVSYILPEIQNAVEDNIEANLNFSYSRVPLKDFVKTIYNNSTTSLKFYNACAMIELTVPNSVGDKKVTSILLKSNDRVSLTGKGVVDLQNTDYKSTQNVVPDPFSVTVNGSDFVELVNSEGFKVGKKYYAVVWPGKHSSGLTFTFVAEDGTVASKSTQKETVLEASHVKPYTFSSELKFEAVVREEYDYVYEDGTMGNDVKDDIVGVVVFHGNPKEKFNDPDLPNQYCNGLAISVKTYSTMWHTSQPSTSNSNIKISSNTNLPSYDKGGYTVKNIWESEGISLNIYNASNYDTLNGNTSGWYHGTPMEWKYILENLSEINGLLSKVPGASQIAPANNSEYALPLYYYGTKNWIFYINGGALTYKAYGYNFTSYAQTVRPIFAF